MPTVRQQAAANKRYLSDLAGIDPKSHKNEVPLLIDCVREWLASKSKNPHQIPHSPYIVEKYQEFQKALPAICAGNKWVPAKLLFPEYLSLASAWIAARF